MIWNYYVLPGFVARMEEIDYAKSSSPKVEVRFPSGDWVKPENVLEMQHMISRNGTRVDEATAAQAFKHFQSAT